VHHADIYVLSPNVKNQVIQMYLHKSESNMWRHIHTIQELVEYGYFYLENSPRIKIDATELKTHRLKLMLGHMYNANI
jgi:hypothetical protein